MNDAFRVLNKPTSVCISRVKEETPLSNTFFFQLEGIQASPGQFFMVWIPGIDEIPMSISKIDNPGNEYGFTVAMVGEATRALYDKEQGDIIGIRGPYGRGFTLDDPIKNPCIVGGGTGMAAVKPLLHTFLTSKSRVTVINAARTESQLLYHEELGAIQHSGIKYLTSTDDGTCGEQCFGHELLEMLLRAEQDKIEKVFCCGPEIMMERIFDLCQKHDLPLEISMERVMRCGFGICGLCGLDDGGLMVCKDGPVFSSEDIKEISEFGKYKRDFSGAKKSNQG
ncbi:dihydroorotate dehydrogenase electron transfer subunit [Candidatus Bathyarchaeota archaeon]|nr:dihydroorotate dehydrogenase electron transfer subunit [Candidatus Bathyarchaeota archaeon]